MSNFKSVVVLAGGEPPSREGVSAQLKLSKFLVCADGGANTALRLGIKPNVIIGDLDSVSKAALSRFKAAKLIEDSDQETTDLEKALNYCIQIKRTDVHIFGASGMRVDHSAVSLGVFFRYRKKLNIWMHDDFGVLSAINRSLKLEVSLGEKFSLIPVNKCTGVRTTGLKFPLRGESLELGVRDGISNEASAAEIEISLRSGILLLYRRRESHTRPR